MAHKLPGQLARLVGRLYHPDDHFFIHIDAKVDVAPFEASLAQLGMLYPNVVLCADRKLVRWGGFGEVEAVVSAARLALADHDWTHVVLLSGQDYPLKSTAEVRDHFAQNARQSFMFSSAGKDPWPEDDRLGNETWYWDGDLRRLAYRYYRIRGCLVVLPGRWSGGLPRRRLMPAGMRPLQGSAWWALHRDAIEWIVQYVDRHLEVNRFFAHVLIPAENYFQMLLDISPHRSSLVQDDLHFQLWDSWHPRILEGIHLEALLRTKKLFGRKFDETLDAGVLDEIDRHLG